MGHLPGLLAAPCLKFYYICFSWRRVTCASQLSSGPWMGPLRSGAQLLALSKASSPSSRIKGVNGEAGVLAC